MPRLVAVVLLLAAMRTDPARAACCGATRMVVASAPGTMKLGTLASFPFPAGVLLTMDAAASSDSSCKHDVLVPTDGFTVPTFCLPALGYTVGMTAVGCEGGSPLGAGTMWDGNAACADADVTQRGDTLDGACDNHAPPCKPTGPANDLGARSVTHGDGTCDPAGIQEEVDIPVRVQVWLDDAGKCPDDDGVFDAGTDTAILEFTSLLNLTTAISTAVFADSNGDGCFREGAGPTGPITHFGAPEPGPCCAVGQPLKLAATGVAFTGSAPLFDLLFQVDMPANVTDCGAWVASAGCTLPGGCPPPPPTTTTVTVTSTTYYTGPTDAPHKPTTGGNPPDTKAEGGPDFVIFVPNTPVSWVVKIPPWPFRGIPIVLFALGFPAAAFGGLRGSRGGGVRVLGLVMCATAVAILFLFPY